MKVVQEIWTNDNGWQPIYKKGNMTAAQLVFVFGGRKLLSQNNFIDSILEKYAEAKIVFCSTSGEIAGCDVTDDTLTTTAIQFSKTDLKIFRVNIEDFDSSFEAGETIVKALCKEDLNHVFVLSDGHQINGSELVKGLNQFSCKAAVTGGLAGDGTSFEKTLVGLNSLPREGEIVAIGFYGDALEVGFGTMGGWEAFGPQRKVTKSEGNVLYELDGQSALSLYKKYLGEAANELPGSALYFPLSIQEEGAKTSVVRTILSIDEEAESMTFAGDIPMGSIAQLMMNNPEKLIDGAEMAAEQSVEKMKGEDREPDLAILVSCVGRKIVLGQSVDEEVEVVKELMGDNTAITGFYSYGEIAPQKFLGNSELHNQTMTITTFKEYEGLEKTFS